MRYLLCFALFLATLNAKAQDLTVGVLACLTGPCAVDGIATQRGLKLAADELNAEGGILGQKITFVTEDSEEAVTAAKAVTAYRRLRLNKQIRLIIGPNWTPASLALAPIIAKEKGLLVITPSSGASAFHKAAPHILNVRGVDETSARSVARLALSHGHRSAAVFSSKQPWEEEQGQFFDEEFNKGGGRITTRIEPLPSELSLASPAKVIMAGHPDAIFFSSYTQLGLAAREIEKLGFNGAKYLAYTDAQRLGESGTALEGAIFPQLISESEEFFKKYQDRFHEAPASIAASTSYDALKMYAQVVTDLKSFEQGAIISSLRSMNREGASGNFHLDAEGCAVRTPVFKQVKNGIIQAYKSDL